ncbi:hypothetical protein FGIG_07417 [Fasciola gigantica]|uniref:Uncharacterized protein n=1 Tax=Fasciola gigantica TaxID=46835 RepID=A0A504YG91_FASGI|nr:hypothetical protein FGIG_07417 [Fasciola gigantica]
MFFFPCTFVNLELHFEHTCSRSPWSSVGRRAVHPGTVCIFPSNCSDSNSQQGAISLEDQLFFIPCLSSHEYVGTVNG